MTKSKTNHVASSGKRASPAPEAYEESDFKFPLLEAVPFACAVYRTDSGKLLSSNQRFRDEFSSLPEHTEKQSLLEALTQQDAQLGEVRAPHSGRWYTLNWAEAESQGVTMSVLTAIDINERIESLDSRQTQQEKLLFTSRMMSVGEMAATLAHELNQPLGAIINYLNGSLRLLANHPASAQLERALLAARTQAEHASAIISRVREFVRSRAPQHHRQDVSILVSTVIELLRLEAERLQLKIDIDLAPELPQVFIDKVMVEQVLLNLVKNAMESMRDIPAAKRKLSIQGRINLDNEVEIRVSDRGHGLSDETKDQLFSPFFTTKADGLGIGLSICRSIIEYHKGRLFFEPRAGGGSVFAFTLPSISAEDKS